MAEKTNGELYSPMLHALAMASSSTLNTILEVGAGPVGGSGLIFAEAMREMGRSAPRIFSIDIDPAHPSAQALLHVRETLGVEWVVVHGDSLRVPLDAFPAEVDLLYIDGDHGGDHAIGDYHRLSPLVRKGGLIVFDDFPIAEGVAAAVAGLIKEGVIGLQLVYNHRDGNSHYVIRK